MFSRDSFNTLTSPDHHLPSEKVFEMRMERGPFLVPLTMMMVMATFAIVVMTGSDGMMSASASVQFSTQEQYADPPEEGTSTAVYLGTVTAQAVLAKGQTLILYPVLMNDCMEHSFDPPEIMMDQETIGTEVPFEMSVFVDRKVQAGEVLLEVKVRWKNQPGALGGISESCHVKLFVGEIEDGEVYSPGSLDVVEGEPSVMEIEVQNTGNTWNEYHLTIEGIDLAVSKGILMESDGNYDLDLYYQSKESIMIDIYPDDINGDTTITLTLILGDRDTGEEYDRRSVRIDAMKPVGPSPKEQPDNTHEDDDRDGDVGPPEDPEGEGPPVEDPEAVQEYRSDNGVGAWIIFPLGIVAMAVGIGSYLFIALGKRGTKG
jgi:hypothetical protein